jgi:hypothetical protein
MPPKNCTATKRDGSPCNGYAVAHSDYCFHHDPARAAERRQARSKGGRARHGRHVGPVGRTVPVPLDTMADVAALLKDAINTTLQLENSIQRARTVGYLAGLLIKALDFSTVEERLTQVERALSLRDPAP